MGASFNKTSWRLKGDVIGTEFRALNNLGWVRSGDLLGLTGWGPNINLARECVPLPLPYSRHSHTCMYADVLLSIVVLGSVERPSCHRKIPCTVGCTAEK
jgi:hypothetical protein|eukprot:COSAG02_NODE_4249_length_5586_cov_14.082377_7_plen_100_part_00